MPSIRSLQKSFLLVGLVFLLALAATIFGRSKDLGQNVKTASLLDDREKEAASLDEESSKIQLREFHRVEIKDGKKIWEVKAKDAKFYSDDGTTQVDDVFLEIFRDEGGNIKIEAKTARLKLAANSTAENSMERADLEGAIKVVMDDTTSMLALSLIHI